MLFVGNGSRVRGERQGLWLDVVRVLSRPLLQSRPYVDCCLPQCSFHFRLGRLSNRPFMSE